MGGISEHFPELNAGAPSTMRIPNSFVRVATP
jgi:hypothetical protein